MRKLFRVVDVLVDADDFGATIIVLNQENFRYAASHLSPSFAVELFGKLGEPIVWYVTKAIKRLEEAMKATEDEIKECDEALKKHKKGYFYEHYTRSKEEAEKRLAKLKEMFKIYIELLKHAESAFDLVNKLEEIK